MFRHVSRTFVCLIRTRNTAQPGCVCITSLSKGMSRSWLLNASDGTARGSHGAMFGGRRAYTHKGHLPSHSLHLVHSSTFLLLCLFLHHFFYIFSCLVNVLSSVEHLTYATTQHNSLTHLSASGNTQLSHQTIKAGYQILKRQSHTGQVSSSHQAFTDLWSN